MSATDTPHVRTHVAETDATPASATPPSTTPPSTTPPSTTPPSATRPARSAFRRLVSIEIRLLAREPLGLLFVFGLPVLTVLVISGSFAADDPAFGGATPADYYLAAYIGVTLTAVGLVMLPVHLASYRERGVLRRFHSSSFPSWSLAAAWMVVGGLVAVAGIATLLVTDQLVYGVPAPDHVLLTMVSVTLAVVMFVDLGIFLGMTLPGARSAQAAGLALFFPSFLLGGAGPPPQVMPSAMTAVANLLPTTHAVRAIQASWLSIGDSAVPHLAVMAGITLVATVGSVRSSVRPRDR